MTDPFEPAGDAGSGRQPGKATAPYAHPAERAVLGKLAGGMAHDVNNTLTAVMGHTEFLQHQVAAGTLDPETLERSLRDIRSACERAATVARRLVAIARPLGAATTVDVTRLVRDVVGRLSAELPSGVTLDAAAARSDVSVCAEPERIEAVLSELVRNAVDALPDGGRIAIAVEEQSAPAGMAEAVRTVCVSVSDTGTGMRAEDVAHVFDPFFTTKPKHRGIGLGLMYVAVTVRALGGVVTVESREGAGSAFRVFLPATDGRKE